jgi:hypothetical protein
MKQWWHDTDRVKQKYSEKAFSSATFFTTNLTWIDLGGNPGLHAEKPATNRLSRGKNVEVITCTY